MKKTGAENNFDEKKELKNRPRVGITMGDPAGIGPEVVVKALTDRALFEVADLLVIGDLALLNRVAKGVGAQVKFFDSREISDVGKNEAVPVFDLENLAQDYSDGAESGVAGKASVEYIEKAVDLWKEGKIDAITTAPINKKAIAMGGYDYPGHTEMLAKLTETEDFAMSFFANDMCVVLLSTHVSLKKAIELVKKENLVELIKFTNVQLEALLKKKVRIAVAGVNPHASEDGLFGTEEEKEILPAIRECRKRFGIDVSGPFSADTIFLRGFQGEFDSVISCYHDQATVAVKCLSFGASVNVTLGLPLIRTSVDHGTAFDIAGKNMADASSMNVAIKLAGKLAGIRNHS